MVGTLDQVLDKFAAFKENFGCTDFILSTHFVGTDLAKGTRSLELFAHEMMPKFR